MNQKLLFMLFVFCVLTHVNVQSQSIKKDNIIYLLEDDKAFILGFNEKATKVTIEHSVSYKKHTYHVVGVKLDSKQNPCYDGKTIEIREMVFAEGITEVFDKVAVNMIMLEKVVLPSTITLIGQSAFSGCKSLKEINIPKSMTSIGVLAFQGCTNLKTFSMPDSVKTIGKEAFKNCTSLQEIMIPTKLKRIGTGVFWGCSALTKANIQCPINRLPACFFRDCKALKSIIIRPYIKSIDWEAFRGCTSLVAMNIPQKVTSVGINAFYGCTSLRRVKFPKGLREISRGAFSDCSSLKEIMLPKGLKTISEKTFQNCESMVSINIRDSVTVIGKEAFSGCTALEEIVIPPTVNEIGQGAFSDCSSLSSIILKCNSIDKIPNKCFSGCKSLNSIVIPNSVRSFGVETFKDCTNLEEIILPDSAKYLTDREATILSLPSYNKSLPDDIFTDRGTFYKCEFLTNIKCHNGSTPVDILNYIPKSCPFALRGGKSGKPDFDKALLASVTSNNPVKRKAEILATRKFKYVIASDVDMSIPEIDRSNDKTYAIIIGNENYDLVPYVKYAENDARYLAEYCHKTLGLPEKNINVIYDATYEKMVGAVQFLDSVSHANNGQINVLFYYSGHGVPDERTRNSFLLPIDEDGSNTEGCYAVSKLYKDLAGINTKRTLVFLDACFSGSQRDGGVLQASARGVAIKAKDSQPTKNMIIFSAATGDETAYPFEGKSHGMFTYFLLKKIKETQGDVTLGELADHIKKNVGKTSVLENKKSQTPTFSVSQDIGSSWMEMKLR